MTFILCSVVADEFGDSRELSEWVSKLDKTLKIQVFYALESIKKNPSSKSNYSAAYQALKAADSSLTVSLEKNVRDRWEKKGFNVFKFDGSADPGTARLVQGWATKFVTGVEPSVSEVAPASLIFLILRLLIPNLLQSFAFRSVAILPCFERTFFRKW